MQVVTHVAVAGAYAGLAFASGTVKIINLQEVRRPALLKLLTFFATPARLLQLQPGGHSILHVQWSGKVSPV